MNNRTSLVTNRTMFQLRKGKTKVTTTQQCQKRMSKRGQENENDIMNSFHTKKPLQLNILILNLLLGRCNQKNKLKLW